MKKIVVTYSIPKEGLASLEKDFELIYPKNKVLFSRNELIELLPTADAVITVFTQPFDAELLNAASKAKIIANYGVGYNNIQIDLATKLGIKVTNTPNSVTEPTAEMAMALMLSLVRRVAEADRSIRNKTIEWGLMKNLGTTLRNKTLGIIGMGRIGQSTARKAKAFGMNVVYFSRNSITKEIELELDTKKIELNELLEISDVVSVHLPLNEHTKHIIDREKLLKIKKGAFLINTARGPIVDENALIEVIKSGQLAGAALDVFEFEPKISEGLLDFENVVLTPHIGTGTFETRTETSEEVAKNILAYFSGNNPPNWINHF